MPQSSAALWLNGGHTSVKMQKFTCLNSFWKRPATEEFTVNVPIWAWTCWRKTIHKTWIAPCEYLTCLDLMSFEMLLVHDEWTISSAKPRRRWSDKKAVLTVQYIIYYISKINKYSNQKQHIRVHGRACYYGPRGFVACDAVWRPRSSHSKEQSNVSCERNEGAPNKVCTLENKWVGAAIYRPRGSRGSRTSIWY